MQEDWNLLPVAALVQPAAGALGLAEGLRLVAAEPPAGEFGMLVERFQHRFDRLLGRAAGPAAAVLQLRLAGAQASPAELPALSMVEQFALQVSPADATLTATAHWGLAQGLERCLQLVRPGPAGPELPAGVLEDGPRLPWRGLLLDLARHFLGLPALLRTLDGMAAAGLNVLHLHLNDDQGFALECPRRPRLHRCAAPQGYLSTDDARRLVAAAAERGIRVVPELDVPGHAGAILWAYPELAIGAAPARLPRQFGQTPGALDPTLPATWAFVDDVLADLTDLFPDAFLHVGGDEVHPDAYRFEDRAHLDWMAARALQNAADVQNWFMTELSRRVLARGRTPVAWDEVLHPDLPREVVIQSWRGAASLEAALAAGHDAIFSAGYYLDLNYPAAWHYRFVPDAGPEVLAAAEAELRSRAELLPVAGALAAMHRAAGAVRPPLPAQHTPGRILGGEACLWGELVNAETLDRRLYSRLAAVAERLWSPLSAATANNAPDDLACRLPGWLSHLEAVSDCRPLELPAAALRRWGVQPGERRPFADLLDALVPVRWYRRLLGEEAMARRLAGGTFPAADRPYDADSPLAAPVDQLCPDSLTAMQLARDIRLLVADDQQADAARERIRLLARRWRELPAALAALFAREPGLAALAARTLQLARLGGWLEAWLAQPEPALAPALAGQLLELAEEAGEPQEDVQLAVLEPLLELVGGAQP